MADEDTASTHPPQLPPKTEDDRFLRLRLLRSSRVGIATYHRLLSDHGSPQAALDALPGIAAAAGVEKYRICPTDVIRAELKAAQRANARLLVHGSADYPVQLNDLNDAPPLLWAIGDHTILHRPMVALVGARNASSLGTRMAKRLAAELGEAGYLVVSGLARGVDTAAHLGSLATGTVAVQAGGVDIIYPAENRDLASKIMRNGLRVAEMPMGLQPQARHFPARNRIIAGLAQAVVVVEAGAKSGSLITARTALDQGRDVLAVPGHPFDARAAGSNMLIRDGATLIRSAEDVLDVLSPLAKPVPVAPHTTQLPLRQSADLHSEILARLSPSPIAEDQLIRDLSASSAHVIPALTTLELDGKITRQKGGLLSRVV
jgi:DNA processing protein